MASCVVAQSSADLPRQLTPLGRKLGSSQLNALVQMLRHPDRFASTRADGFTHRGSGRAGGPVSTESLGATGDDLATADLIESAMLREGMTVSGLRPYVIHV